MDEELAFLRAIAANPYDRTGLGAYADWLDDRGRADEARVVRRHANATAPVVSGNSISVGELVGHLLTMPLGAPVIYEKYSDWAELRKDEVTLHTPEEKQVAWREGHGFYNPRPYQSLPGDGSIFVTVCCFPGN